MGPGSFSLRYAQARRLRALVAAALVALAMVFSATPAQAQQGGTGTAQTQVSVQTPGSIVKVADINFGSIAQANNTGTVTALASATPGCAVTGALIRLGTCQAARFSIYGKRNWKVRIKDTSGGLTTLNGPGGATMTMNNLTIGPVGMSPFGSGNGWNLGQYNIDTNSGVTEFYLGGTLNVGIAQTPGVYRGTVIIQIQFN